MSIEERRSRNRREHRERQEKEKEERRVASIKEKELAEVRTNVAPNRKKLYVPSAPEIQERIDAENAELKATAEDILKYIGQELIDELHEQKIPASDVAAIQARWSRQLMNNNDGPVLQAAKERGCTTRNIHYIWAKHQPTIERFQNKLREVLIQTPEYIQMWLARIRDGCDIHSQTGPNSTKVVNEMMNPRYGIMQNFGTVNQNFGGQQQNITAPTALMNKTSEELEDEIARLDRGEVIEVEAE